MIKKHWTLTYIKNRIKNYIFEKLNPEMPWINPDAINIFEGLLLKKDIGIEFGSGSSTVWYSKRVKKLISIEDHKEWFKKIKEQIDLKGVSNIEYIFKSTEGDNPLETDYYNYLSQTEDASIDFIVIDGKFRDILALEALKKVKIGGFIFLDDSQRYIPYKTKSPYSIHKEIEKMSSNWILFNKKVQYWRKIQTTNGVSDATFFIKTQ
jgi:predicted O-methyltransferase YrrM